MSGGDESGLSADSFWDSENNRVKVDSLAMTVLGGFLTVWGVGVAGVIDAVFQLPISIYRGIGSFLASGISGLGNGFASLLAVGWTAATSVITGLTGVWVPVVSIVIVLTFLYLVLGGYDE